ncbi:hypothetical protein M407DRAFT_18001 [Tulasnella calospora MUT 4182]|uniref:F-box domain-containing protein n=1 Tax=Tulasnella calospora MUT 4182 TaxID=1051891 RepID=A0A0C3QUN4_9AGAM|nr:hypothetical protein M407DRAFT_18001 [Tulasnella calospora MUT 4182]
MSIPGDGLNGLPSELICNIFRLVINPSNPRKERCRLMLVCRRWREYVEGSALLWTTISAYDGLSYMRRALENCRGAMIDITFPLSRSSAANLEALAFEGGPHIPRWRSLILALRWSRSWESTLAPLTRTQAPNLEILKLLVRHAGEISANPITLFGGAPAPSTLKNITLDQIPVAFEPLGLSGLVSLNLKKVPTISTPQLLEILRDSPGLERLYLISNPSLVAIGSQASTIQPIELPKLVSLSLKRIDNGGTGCILSNIRIPNRRRVSIRANVRGVNPRSALFTSAITHIFHTTIPTADLSPSAITVEGYDVDGCSIKFRGIELALVVDGEDRVQDMLGWLVDGLGPEAAECPVHLIHGWSRWDPVRFAAVPPPLVIKHLTISDSASDLLRKALYAAMTRAPDPPSSDWFLPQMESFSVGLGTMESQKQLISMLKNRYEGGETESRCPMNLRSVKLRGEPRTEGLVEEIKGILGEVHVFWAN